MSMPTQPQSISDYAKDQESITLATSEIAKSTPIFSNNDNLITYVAFGISIIAIIIGVVAIFKHRSK